MKNKFLNHSFLRKIKKKIMKECDLISRDLEQTNIVISFDKSSLVNRSLKFRLIFGNLVTVECKNDIDLNFVYELKIHLLQNYDSNQLFCLAGLS